MAIGLFKKSAPLEQRAGVGSVLTFHDNGRAIWSSRDPYSLVRQGFRENPVGFRSVKLISESAASVPFRLSFLGNEYDVHPLISLIKRPNQFQSRSEFFEALYGALTLYGNGYIEAVSDGTDLNELHVLRPDRVEVVTGKDGWPIGYDYKLGKTRKRYLISGDQRPILHLKNYHPQDDHYGLGPLEAAAASVDVHNSATRWSKALLDNAARPSGAIVYSPPEGAGVLSQEQYQRLYKEIEDNHAGAKNAGRPMLLDGGLDWKPMGFSPSDMEFQKTKETAAREIALSFGVPPMLLGLPGDATYANYQEANRAFFRLTILPLVTRVATELAAWWGEYFDEKIEITPDLDALPALAAERESLWRRVSDADFLSDDEKRHLLGLGGLHDE